MTTRPIYLDYMATTPVDPRVIEHMLHYLGPDGHFGNPASIQHAYGQTALHAVDRARSQIAETIGANAEDIIFTSGATEANNLAILGAARFYQRKGRHLITLLTEHKSVLDTFRQLEHEGFDVTYLKPEPTGLLAPQTLLSALRKDTILVSIMQVNNEIGVIQDIHALGDCLRNKGILFHVDAAQSAGRLPIDLKTLPVHLMSFSAHKNYGPKGIGALYIRQRPRVRLQAQSFGGGHEKGLRSGTLATHQIVGMGEAFLLSESLRAKEQARILAFRQRLWDGISGLDGIQLNGSMDKRIAGNLHFSIRGIDGALLLPALSELAVSTMSACASASLHTSHVLRAIGLDSTLANSSIRLSIGRYTTEAEIQRSIEIICQGVALLLR